MRTVLLIFALASTLALAADCPDGATPTGAGPPEGTARGCQKQDKSGEWVRHGRWTEYYMNGQKREEGEYLDGRQVGAWTWWYPDGSKKQEGKFWDDRPVGKWAYWDRNGNRKEKTIKPGTSSATKRTGGLDSFSKSMQKGFTE